MESSRRSFDRSREPGLKKPRLAEEIITGSPNGQRQAASVSSSGSTLSRFRAINSERGVRETDGSHLELVSQYKTALAELTFNSKPIITNLTIIAGENSPAAKAIAAAICTNILEVPTEQKLPSLYLLDSIVKNIGRDYIKYFAARLPEVFCKAYRQVDPAIHPGMRHLFGTWKGVFPPQTLQFIEKELGLSAIANGSTSGTAVPRPDSQSQRPGHSIHVNPKYLEARQRFQQSSKVKGAATDAAGTLVGSSEEAEKVDKTSSLSSGRPWVDPHNIQRPYRDSGSDLVLEKNIAVGYRDYEHGSSISRHPTLGLTKANEAVPDQGFDKPCYGAGTRLNKVHNQQNGLDGKLGFPNFTASKPAISGDIQPSHSFPRSSSSVMNRSWKNSEEEEYVWDDTNSRSTDHITENSLRKDLTLDDSETLDLENHFQNHPSSMHDREASTDSLHSEQKDQVAFGYKMSSLLSKEPHSSDWRSHSGANRIMPNYSEGHSASLSQFLANAWSTTRTPYSSLMGSSDVGLSANISGSTGSVGWQHRGIASVSPSKQSPMQRSPSPSFSDHHSNQLAPGLAEKDYVQGEVSPNVDSTSSQFSGQWNTERHNRFAQDSPALSLKHRHTNLLKLQPSNVQALSPAVASLQPKRSQVQPESTFSGPSVQSTKILSKPAIENLSTTGNSSADDTDRLSAETSGLSSTSRLLANLLSGMNKSITADPPRPRFPDAGLSLSEVGAHLPLPSSVSPTQRTSSRPRASSPSLSSSHSSDSTVVPDTLSQRNLERPPLPPGPSSSSIVGSTSAQTSNGVNAASNPVSTLLSSLVAKGLIAPSKSEPATTSSTEKSILPKSKGVVNSDSMSASSVCISTATPLLSSGDFPAFSQSDIQSSEDVSVSIPIEIKNTIGFEFKPDVIRMLHPPVISELLTNLPHRCNACGLQVKFEELLDRHLQWHAFRNPEQNKLNKASRCWYANSDVWVTKETVIESTHESTAQLEGYGKSSENNEPMVPADETQCVCFLCGEMFQDFYCEERDEWMFKGAIYMNAAAKDDAKSKSRNNFEGPIVHAKCVSETSDAGLEIDDKLKMETD